MKFYIDPVDQEDFDPDRDEEWEEVKEDQVNMSRGEWEYYKNVEDYGLTKEDMDSGDDEDF